ncbi:hypothetical protein F5148DRAFT_1146554 [Russula earlei]|uniref:Uncharacterized protein n=1 Tax=Russula earlei TaxID=71964 RepID=A0ACC0UKJ9_9AGAM|nr:hypothetical protein F5148DRAFT_1146554 [Russula earlei]
MSNSAHPRAPSFPVSSDDDDDECSFSPFTKREYLLAQMKQKDELIDSLVNQTSSHQLHNLYLATTLSIEAYRDATSSNGQRQQNVIGAGVPGARSTAPSSSSEDVPVSPNTLVESDIDPYPDDADPNGLLQSLRSDVTNKSCFMPGPSMDLGQCESLVDKTSPPDILVHRLLTPDDMEKSYILLSIYAVPARRWEEDRSWLYTGDVTGLAIQIATDLNPHILPPKKPTNGAAGAGDHQPLQFGKPSTLKEDFIVRKSLEWYKSSPNNHPEWAERFERDSDAGCEFRVLFAGSPVFLSRYRYTNYARLVMFSFGFQNAFQWGLEADDEVFFTRSLESAKTVVTVLVDSLVPTGHIRFAPSGYFVFAAFASAFMLKVYQVIERLIATIRSRQIAIDERHTPKLYSRFLASLLAKHKRDGTAQGRMPQQGPPPQQMQTGSSTPRYQQPPQPPQPQPPQQQQQRQQQQPAPPPQNTTSSLLSSGVSGIPGTPDLHQSVPKNSGATALPNFTNAVSTEGPGNYVLE